MNNKKSTSVRLPNFVKPIRYELTLKPDLDAFVFEGSENIEVVLDKVVESITLHSKELEIEKAEYETTSLRSREGLLLGRRRETTSSAFSGDSFLAPTSWPGSATGGEKASWSSKITYDTKAETATIHFGKKLPKGKGILRLVFRGVLNDKLRGFYRSKYLHEGKEKYMATTQFEPVDARRAFPCFDEPTHKAIFDISVIYPEHLTAISNTLPINIQEHSAGYKIVKFAPSPKMSTYLVALLVGDFEHIESKTRARKNATGKARFKEVVVRVFTTPGKTHQGQFALDTAVRALEFFEEYFDIAYPLPILDLIAIPDFSSAAMENWGAITYRETALLFDSEHTSAANKEWIAIVIAHEIAHQWFGNLVTMEWWTHLWLNEGFASYMEHVGVAHLFPKWDMWTQFCDGRLNQALELDALKSTHPIEINVHHPSEINEIFDMISYAKGASVIRMLAEYLGEKNFRDGLRIYLKRHAYANASTEHLWRALEQASGQRVAKIMKNWTSMPGYPLVKFQMNQREVIVEQQRFFASELEKNKSKDKTIWNIPLTYNAQGGKKPYKQLVTKKIAIVPVSKKGWVKFNAREAGVYRTAYPPKMISALIPAVKNKQLDPEDRLGLIRDAFALAESGDMPTVQALKLAQAYSNENNYSVWAELVGNLNILDNLLFGHPAQAIFRVFALGLVGPRARILGFTPKKNETHQTSMLRGMLLGAAGRFGDRSIIAKAKSLLHRVTPKKNPIHPDIRGAVYYIVAAWGGLREYKKMQTMFLAAGMQEEKERIGRNMAYFQDAKIVRNYIAFAMSKQVRSQDAPFFIASTLRNPHGRTIAWQYVRKNWKTLVSRYGIGGSLLNRIVQSLGSFTDEKVAQEAEDFFKKSPTPGMSMTIQQTLEHIRALAAWKKRDIVAIEQWLRQEV